MQPGNPVVGGTVLRRPAIQSPNYAAGSAGWSIKADGTAEFSSAVMRGELDVGSIAASRIAITQTPPVALQTFYTGLGETITSVILFYDASGGYEYVANLSGGGLAIGVVPAGGSVLELEFKWGGASNQGVNMSREIFYENQGIVEGWHHIAGGIGYQNGWGDLGSGTMLGQYRKLPSPATSVQLVGMIGPGIVVDGTTLFTLPVGYRPQTTIVVQVGCNKSVSGGQVPVLQITNAGAVQCFGINVVGINQVNMCMIFPTDV